MEQTRSKFLFMGVGRDVVPIYNPKGCPDGCRTPLNWDMKNKFFLVEEGKEDTGSNSRTHNTGHIGTHGVLEEVVGAVVLEANIVRHTGGVGHSTDAGVADEGIDFVTVFQEEVENLHEQDTEEGGHDEGEGTQTEDEHRTASEE